MEKLRQQLDGLLNRLEKADELRAKLVGLISIYPFNEFEYILSHLLAAHKLTLHEYDEIRSEYIERNQHSHLFEISAPRNFGEAWAESYVKELVPSLQRSIDLKKKDL